MDKPNKVARRTQSLSQLVLPSSSVPRVEYGSKPPKTSRRPRTAPSSPHAGRKLLTSRAYRNKSSYRRQQARTLSSRQSTARTRRSRPPTCHFSRPTTSTAPTEKSQLQKSASSVAIVKTSGYSLHRSPSKITMNIAPDAFFGDKRPSSSAREASLREISQTVSKAVEPIQAALDDAIKAQQGLQLEVAQLSLKIEDEKEKHKNHVEELEKDFEMEKLQLSKAHEISISELKMQHEREMDFLHSSHAEQLQNLRQTHDSEIASLEEKVQLANDTLEKTKAQLQKELEESLKKRTAELRERHAKELEQLRVDMKEETKRQLAQQKDKLEEKHQLEIKELREEHEGEIQVLLSQLKKASELEEKLEESNRKIETLESEIELLNAELKQSHQEQLKVEAELLETKEKLEKFENDFLDKVKAVENSYRDRMDGLMTENTALRRRWLNKTDEFCRYQSGIEKSQAQTIRRFKDTIQLVVKARSRADIGVAFGALEELSNHHHHHHHQPGSSQRPRSAPTTRLESLRACRQVTASTTPSAATQSPQGKREVKLSRTVAQSNRQRLRPKSCFVTPTQVT